MPLIKSISGIRGTIGGKIHNNLTPIDIVESTSAFGQYLLEIGAIKKVVIGRDGRISGKIVSEMVSNTLIMMGIDVIDLGLSTTPTVEIAVPAEKAGGGIILTASHNPKQWNALKLLNARGECVNKITGDRINEIIKNQTQQFAKIEHLGSYTNNDSYFDTHITAILNLPFVEASKIRAAKFSVVVDAINSTGALVIPKLLDRLNIKYNLINGEITGDFAHDPEPLPKNISQLCHEVRKAGADLGIVVDPDVDRLAFVCEDGIPFGEELTLVAATDFVLSKKDGAAVSNLSSTRALADICAKYDGDYFASAVGEVNVVEKMKATQAVIGGEGNGGVILPELHYGRDALVGIVLVLQLLAERQMTLSQLKGTYPTYVIVKNKIPLDESISVDDIVNKLTYTFRDENINTQDGLKIDFEQGWVHLRKSNTEPIIRVYAEAKSIQDAKNLIEKIMNEI